MSKNRKNRKNTAVNKRKEGRVLASLKFFAFFVLPATMVMAMCYLASGYFKSACRLRSVVMTGNEHLTDEELRVVGGLGPSDNLLTLSGKKVSRKMMGSPWVRSVSVRKEFPDRLLVDIKEAEPFALLDLKGKLFIVDDKGAMLEELGTIAVPFLPVISSDPYREKEAFQEALKFAKAIKKTGHLSRKEHIEIISHKPQEMSANIDGMIVKVGEGEYEEKLGRLADMEEQVKNRKIAVDYIDLRFANRVLVSPVNEVIR